VNIELTDVTRTFGRNKAVDGVSLAVGPGVFGLLGPNGAGKTSLLRMLATVSEFVEYFALLKEMPAHQVPKAVAAAVEELSAQGESHEVGDSPLERGYSAVLAASRKQVAA